ncbi:hypothetical protein K432DRAFT_406767 [Lepidopterella palustris CBS 459.81]|uniref:Uncharacterized protein n=1 Tax=Lepidopterella palustris CBS 459.81 TaxID=1314670 RepID=A0A8E2E627_9PEZI|nr:hypothetical protein K432DRAFT_406767 [Lepidopterella palustris CBS 459.81]
MVAIRSQQTPHQNGGAWSKESILALVGIFTMFLVPLFCLILKMLILPHIRVNMLPMSIGLFTRRFETVTPIAIHIKDNSVLYKLEKSLVDVKGVAGSSKVG